MMDEIVGNCQFGRRVLQRVKALVCGMSTSLDSNGHGLDGRFAPKFSWAIGGKLVSKTHH